MPAKVTLTISKGNACGREYVFDGRESLIVGRQKDCAIVLSESTVSRYHCMLDIAPPLVTARDFGSLNGTFRNDELMGQRDADISVAQGREQRYNEFPLSSGDTLGLGRDCEITISVYIPKFCAECLEELSENPAENYEVKPGQMVCKDCRGPHEARDAEVKKQREAECQADQAAEREKLQAEKQAAELAELERKARDLRERERVAAEKAKAEAKAAEWEAKRKADNERHRKEEENRAAQAAKEEAERAKRNARRCQFCDAALTGGGQDARICPACRNNPQRVLEALMLQALRSKADDAQQIQGYKTIRSLGRGGMGEVWLVEEEATGRRMALKLMLSQRSADTRSREQFLREAHLAQQLNHKNVVRQFSHGSSGDTFFMLLELCEGGSLDDLIERTGGKLDIDAATGIVLQVLDGLIYTHAARIDVKLKTGELRTANGVVHRDLKPGNIFLADTSKNPVVKVADFGLSKAFETAGLSGNTRTGEAAGTPVFMPVQQIFNYRYATPDVDVWAAAASYYFMLTGTYPKDFGDKCKDIWMAALNSSPVPILKRNPKIPRKLAAVIDKALEEQPNIGVRSAAELKKMIEGAL